MLRAVIASAERSAVAAEGTVLGGRYRLGAALGKGGEGSVWAARRVDTGADVAVKLLRADIGRSPEMLARFSQEAQAAARLSHPGIVGVLDFGQDEHGAFLVMELVRGRLLADRLAQGPLSLAHALVIVRGVLEALAHAHALGVVHRDLKPANVMMVDRITSGAGAAQSGGIKLLDFGVARVVEPAEADAGPRPTMPGVIMGTPEYLSPEQALGEPGDARADLYAVGVVFYEMLVGARPFVGATRHDVLAAHISRPVPRLAETAPQVASEALQEILDTALAKDRGERFASADDFLTALEALDAQAGAPTLAPPRPPRPTWLRLTIAGVAAVAIAAGAVLVSRALAPAPRGQPLWPSHSVPSAALDDAAAALAHGEVDAARDRAAALVVAHPEDPRALAVLGHALLAAGDKRRGFAAYREALRLDPAWTPLDGELRANLRASLSDPKSGEAAFALAEQVGPLAVPMLVDFYRSTRDAKLQKRAVRAVKQILGEPAP